MSSKVGQSSVEDDPPPYTQFLSDLPKTFPIGGKEITPLVNVTDLQAHLKLLGAINRLKQRVQDQEEGVAATDSQLAWVAYITRAVYRFEEFMNAEWTDGVPCRSEDTMPPLDILMVWHTYLLASTQIYYIYTYSPFLTESKILLRG